MTSDQVLSEVRTSIAFITGNFSKI
jgi:hypothetical protein